MAKDPVCWMQVDERQAAATAVHTGTTYYFCAEACRWMFETTPGQYVADHAGH